MKPTIVSIHLLNDYSGSPRILSQVLSSFVQRSYKVDLYTSQNGKEGFLSHMEGVNAFHFSYQWHPNKWRTLFSFFMSQCILFFTLLRYRKQNVLFYVNTVLPIGAALAGKLMGKKVIYHIHETSIKPRLFKKLLFFIAQKTASEAIYVSHYLHEQEPLRKVNCHVIYNALSSDFIAQSHSHMPSIAGDFQVLMLSSLKEYKGVHTFVSLAKSIAHCTFELVVNATQEEIDDFFDGSEFPVNLKIYPSQADVHPFYKKAKLVLNLSHPLQWVETFGLTALEAMSYGIPSIVPPVGGIKELVDHGISGYTIDPRKNDVLVTTICNMSKNNILYRELSQKAKTKSRDFCPKMMVDKIENLLL